MKSIIAGRWNAALMAAKRPWPDIPVYVEGSTGKAEIVGTMSCAEIFGELRGENDYCPIPEIEFDELYGDVGEEVEPKIYKACSRGTTPIADCLAQLKRMRGDWDLERYYLMISVGKGRKLEELDTEELELTLGGMRGGITSLFRAGLRVVPTIPDDEVRLFCLYMLPSFDSVVGGFSFMLRAYDFDLQEYIDYRKEVENLAENLDKVRPRGARRLLQANVKYRQMMPVDVTNCTGVRSALEYCEYLYNDGVPIDFMIQQICGNVSIWAGVDGPRMKEVKIYAALVKWAAKRGGNVNWIMDGRTGLDLLNEYIPWCRKRSRIKGRECRGLKKAIAFRDLILKLGGKTAAEVIRDYHRKPLVKDKLIVISGIEGAKR